MKSSALAVLVTLGAAQAAPPSAATIVARASAYVAEYESALGGLVAEEDYTQTQTIRPPGVATMVQPRRTRRLKSDFMLVKFTADEPWIPFRDVLAVDGKPVGDRDARLEQLFLQPGAQARQGASRITDEGARYNLGSMRRNINVPVLALDYLRPNNLARCELGSPRRETIDGQTVWKVDYTERDGPTVIRDGRNGGDVPASGSFWIRDADAAVLRTIVRTRNRVSDFEVEVRYCRVKAIAVLVPCRMSEHFNLRSEEVSGTATYTNIRQFKVTTTESIKH